ncbi:hypothetical protein [Nocardioides sp.]|jgi:hypothetical protein|uniref:hypothetical protein n=1 Tax=Nocardioides sp. TaxID=35761 RepID=UPI00260D0CBE|nr:hypothetical protein [Nocardioides sp.]
MWLFLLVLVPVAVVLLLAARSDYRLKKRGKRHGTLSRDGIGKAHGDSTQYGGPTPYNPQGNDMGGLP